MSDVYSLNPQILPQVPITNEEHHRLMTMAIIAVVAVVVIGFLYWWSVSQRQRPASPIEEQAQLRAEVAALLRSSTIQPTPEEIDRITTQLKTYQVSVSVEERNDVANVLRSSN